MKNTQDHAAAGALNLCIAAFIVTGAFTMLLSAQQQVTSTTAIEPSLRQSDAESLLSILLGPAGIVWDGGVPVRVAFGSSNSSGLSVTELDLMRGALVDADADNGVIDYEEARSALGLDDLEFRLRITPIGMHRMVRDLDLQDVRTAYLGQWTQLSSIVLAEAEDDVLVANANDKLFASASQHALVERDALVHIGLGISPRVHLDTLQLDVVVDPGTPLREVVDPARLAGDVYPDQKAYLDDVFAARLPEYDLLVVGSGVRHSSLTGESVKNAVRDWVLEGGHLLVLGSGSQSSQWLQPVFHVGTANVNGGAYVPDAGHPMLREPHALAWEDYGTPPRVWSTIGGGQGSAADFDRVVTTEEGDVLAVSRAGAFGSGRVIVSAYQPGVLAQAFGTQETTNLLHNLVVYMDRSHLYLEYGLPAPADRTVASAVRHSSIPDDQLGTVPVLLEAWVWSS